MSMATPGCIRRFVVYGPLSTWCGRLPLIQLLESARRDAEVCDECERRHIAHTMAVIAKARQEGRLG